MHAYVDVPIVLCQATIDTHLPPSTQLVSMLIFVRPLLIFMYVDS